MSLQRKRVIYLEPCDMYTFTNDELRRLSADELSLLGDKYHSGDK